MFEREIGLTKLDARNYGALANGLHDDTYAIQCALNALPDGGGTVVLAKGIFLTNPLKSLTLPDRTALEWVEGATMPLMPSAAEREAGIEIRGSSHNMLINPTIIGNRHDGIGDTGEWGHGVAVRGAKHLTIVGGRISDCWGDGISVGSNVLEHSEDVIISGLACDTNRRQGLTIARSRNVLVLDSWFGGTGGTEPQAGIDIEPDAPGESRGIAIRRCKVIGNAGCGILVWRRNEPNLAIYDVVIDDCDVTGNRKAGIWTYGVNGVKVVNNVIRDNLSHGLLLDTGTANVDVMGNRFGYNYARNAITPRSEVTRTGMPATTKDVLVRGASNLNFGLNTYEAQVARPAVLTPQTATV